MRIKRKYIIKRVKFGYGYESTLKPRQIQLTAKTNFIFFCCRILIIKVEKGKGKLRQESCYYKQVVDKEKSDAHIFLQKRIEKTEIKV